MGPLLFILYVNDLLYSVQHCRVRQDADDTTLSCMCGDISDLEMGLTNDVERVANWVEANKVRLNVMKTNLLLIS